MLSESKGYVQELSIEVAIGPTRKSCQHTQEQKEQYIPIMQRTSERNLKKEIKHKDTKIAKSPIPALE